MFERHQDGVRASSFGYRWVRMPGGCIAHKSLEICERCRLRQPRKVSGLFKSFLARNERLDEVPAGAPGHWL
jgi:hypothetical protein